MGRIARVKPMQMKYDYTPPYGHPREGLRSTSTYDAILAGERTATTRFPMWYRNNPEQLQAIKALNPGDVVTFTRSGKPNIQVEVLPTKLSEQQMDLAQQINEMGQLKYPELQGLNGATYAISRRKLEADPRWLDRWSQLEGWSPDSGLKFFAQEPTGVGYQFQYRPIL